MYDQVKVTFHVFLTSTLDRDERSVSWSGCFTPMQEPQYQVDRFMGSTARLDVVVKGNIPAPAGNLIKIIQPVASHFSSWINPALQVDGTNPR